MPCTNAGQQALAKRAATTSNPPQGARAHVKDRARRRCRRGAVAGVARQVRQVAKLQQQRGGAGRARLPQLPVQDTLYRETNSPNLWTCCFSVAHAVHACCSLLSRHIFLENAASTVLGKCTGGVMQLGPQCATHPVQVDPGQWDACRRVKCRHQAVRQVSCRPQQPAVIVCSVGEPRILASPGLWEPQVLCPRETTLLQFSSLTYELTDGLIASTNVQRHGGICHPQLSGTKEGSASISTCAERLLRKEVSELT